MTSRCHLYQPFFGEKVTGDEGWFEQVSVNWKDLNQLQLHLGMSPSVSVAALFGKRQTVVKVARQLLGDDFSLPSEDEDEATSDCPRFYAIVKKSKVLFAVLANRQFMNGDAFNEENILVTLFRYLEDTCPLLLLCPGAENLASFSPGPKNPFSSISHSISKFKQEERINFEITETRVSTRSEFLIRDLGEFALNNLVLNDNGSRYALHSSLPDNKAETNHVDPNWILRKLKPLLLQRFQRYSVRLDELRASASELSQDCLEAMLNEHDKFADKISEQKNQFSSFLRPQLRRLMDSLDKRNTFVWRMLRKSGDDYQPLIEFLTDQLVYSIIETYDLETNTFCWDWTRFFEVCVRYTVEVFRESPNIDEWKKKNKLHHEVYGQFQSSSLGDFLTTCGFGVQSAVIKLSDECRRALASVTEHKRSPSVLRLTPISLNVVQNNEGDYDTMTYAPLAWSVDITPEVLFRLLPADVRKARGSTIEQVVTDEVMKTLRVTSCYGLWNGKLFFVTLRSDRIHSKTMLAAVSASDVKLLKTFNAKDVFIGFDTGEKSSSEPVFMTIIDNTGKWLTLFEVSSTELAQPTPKDSFALPVEVYGKICSSAVIAGRQEILLLNENGSLFRLDVVKKEATELCKMLNTGRRIERKKLVSESGELYRSVHATRNSSFFILLAEHSTDFYNMNLDLLKSIKTTRCRGLKLFWDNTNVYLSLLQENGVTSFILPGICSEMALRALVNDETKREVVRGNPIVDIVHASFLKYGPPAGFIGSPKEVAYHLVVPSSHFDRDAFEKSVRSYSKTFSVKIPIEIAELGRLTSSMMTDPAAMPSERLRAILLSRVPLYICTIEENNVVPLIDGKRHQLGADVASDIANLAERVTFGHLEAVLSTLAGDRPIKIVSIIGRQSSGKSYLLNRLFGTRFSVAATRCTDGIWISYARLVGEDDGVERDFIILDCEGLFSISRNELEEVKLLTILSAVSDVTILNQDLAFNRHLNRLFSDLNSTVDRVKGKNYFRGLLLVAVRDVAAEDSKKAAQEFERNLRVLNQNGDYQFLARLFSGAIMLQCFNSYTSRDSFMSDLENLRTSLLKDNNEDMGISAGRWPDAMTLLQSLKIVLLQVNRDDEQAGDEHVKRVKLLQIESRVLAGWGDMSKIAPEAVFSMRKPAMIASDGDISETVTVAQSDVTFQHPSDDDSSDDCGFKSISKELKVRFFGSDEPKLVAGDYNAMWIAFERFMAGFIAQRIELLQEYCGREIASLEKLSTEEERKHFQTGTFEKIRNLGSRFALCLNKCSVCFLKCVERKGHNEAAFENRQQIVQRLKEHQAKTSSHFETAVNFDSNQCELKTTETEKLTLSGQLQELVEVINQEETTPSDVLITDLSAVETEEQSLAAETSRRQSFIEAKEESIKLKNELERLEKALECFCVTDHVCDGECNICLGDASSPCKFLAGHDGSHLCDKELHDCLELCETCGDRCMYAAGHVIPAIHKCSSTHQCVAPCKYCPKTCADSMLEAHSVHKCNETHCPKRCILCGGPCSGPHDHDEKADLVNDPKAGGEGIAAVRLHLCEQEHRCQNSCEVDGICEVHYVEEKRYLDHANNPLDNIYIRPIKVRKSCMNILPPGELTHGSNHDCKIEKHICDQRCVQCGSFCRGPFGHSTQHVSICHRNMEFCYCVAKTSDGRITVEDTVAGKKVRVYEQLIAETCAEQCKRKGRAHYHLKPCEGGALCGEVVHGDGVKHCAPHERFYPNTDVTYDKYLCRIYWEVQNWAAPTNDDTIQLCNFYCPSSDHPSSDRNFCSLRAWHSHSDLAKDHHFSCHDFSKPTFSGIDICFCIDGTGGMAPYISACSNAIKRIITDTMPQVSRLGRDASSVQFAVVTYRDHCDGDRMLDAIDLTNADAAIGFIDGIKAFGGGDGPEAVMDGLNRSVNLNWRTGTAKVLIHILDAPPHGRHFGSGGDDYPAGCPCGITEDVVLRKMRDKAIQYYVIPLASSVRKMIKIFERYINVVAKTLDSPLDLPAIAANIACRAIDDAELTAT